MQWKIEAKVCGLQKSPEDIYDLVSDPARASVIPGVKKAVLTQGKDRDVGAKYLCDVEMGIFGVYMEVEVILAEPAYRTSAQVNKVYLPGVNVEGKGEWVINKEGEENSLTLTTCGRINGPGSFLLEKAGIDEIFMVEKTKEALRNIKKELNGMV